MCSVSFADLVFDKLFSLSSKMKETSFKQASPMNLLDDSSNVFDLFTGQLFNDVGRSDVIPFDINYNNPLQTPRVDLSLVKSLGNRYLSSNNFNFSPHLSCLMNDSIRYLKQIDMLLNASNSKNIANMFCELGVSKPSEAECLFSNVKTNPAAQEPTSISKPTEQSSLKMSVTVNSACFKDKKTSLNDKVHEPSCLTLNLELSNRKTRELQKRSKKRRRRQKKGYHDKVPMDNVEKPSKSSQLYDTSNSESDTQFIVTVKQQGNVTPTFTSQFLISIAGLSDDDSDWDSFSGNDLLPESGDFELHGLVVANLSAPKSFFQPPHSFDVECSFTAYTEDEAEEISRLEAVLLEVNKTWKERTKDIAVEPKRPSKVSFAAEDYLVEVLPVEMCDRKGEWELYAMERLRFKRRISELEKVISPCLMAEHRSQIYNKFISNSL